jgi:uncharacterized membrane protein
VATVNKLFSPVIELNCKRKDKGKKAMTAQQNTTMTAATEAEKNLKTLSIIVYCFYFSSYLVGITGIIGIIIAHLKKGDAAGTVFESHFSNQIKIFWIGFGLSILGGVLIFVTIGWFIIIGTAIWALYRSIKGLLRAIDGKAYT